MHSPYLEQIKIGLQEAGIASKGTIKVADKLIFGSANLGGLADPTTGLLKLSEFDILSRDPQALGWSASGIQMNDSLTNMRQPSKVDSNTAWAIRGFGFTVDPFVEYSDGGQVVPATVANDTLTLQQATNIGRMTIATSFGSRDINKQGILSMHPAAGMGCRASALATTVNSSEASGWQIGAGAMWDRPDPASWEYVAPNGSVVFNINQPLPAFYLTNTGEAAGDDEGVFVAELCVLRCYLRVTEITGVVG